MCHNSTNCFLLLYGMVIPLLRGPDSYNRWKICYSKSRDTHPFIFKNIFYICSFCLYLEWGWCHKDWGEGHELHREMWCWKSVGYLIVSVRRCLKIYDLYFCSTLSTWAPSERAWTLSSFTHNIFSQYCIVKFQIDMYICLVNNTLLDFFHFKIATV